MFLHHNLAVFLSLFSLLSTKLSGRDQLDVIVTNPDDVKSTPRINSFSEGRIASKNVGRSSAAWQDIEKKVKKPTSGGLCLTAGWIDGIGQRILFSSKSVSCKLEVGPQGTKKYIRVRCQQRYNYEKGSLMQPCNESTNLRRLPASIRRTSSQLKPDPAKNK